MQTTALLSILALAIVSNGATVPASPWTTLTPSGSVPTSVGALSSFEGSFAISIKQIATSVTSHPASATASALKKNKKGKRAATQISDGQVQDNTKVQPTHTVLNQISDGQVQQNTKTASVLAQISDGQVQQQTTASVLAQIGDGQVQQQTTAAVLAQIGDGQVQQQTKTASVLAQIADGQVQQQTKTTAAAVQQISDGQIQQQTKTTAAAVNQISDGQIQQTPAATTAKGQASQITDGQVQATGSSASTSSDDSSSGFEETCAADNSLVVKLNDGVLTDAKGRIGAIVANRQFQFDGPPPQAGTIYAKGWSIVPLDFEEDLTTQIVADTGNKGKGKDIKKDKKEKRSTSWGKLALGGQTTFYRCLSGDFYNLYDESIGGQCSEVEFTVLKIVSC